jgi:CO/xanthine dehydrogenase FAD-binding subunit
MSISMPASLDAALDALAKNPGARLLAGGTDTMVEVNFNRFKPADIIGLRRVPELRSFTVEPDRVVIGAGVSWSAIERGPLASALPALAAAARTVGSPQIRAAGTIGGNLGTCSPAGDGLPVLAALEARVHLVSRRGERLVDFADFMIGVKRNCREADEIISAVSVNRPVGFQDYAKVGTRNAMVISVAGVCLVHDTSTASIRVALGSVGPTIIRATDAEQWLATQVDLRKRLAPDDAIASEFARRVAVDARPISDHRSTAQYRSHAVQTLTRRLYMRGTR